MKIGNMPKLYSSIRDPLKYLWFRYRELTKRKFHQHLYISFNSISTGEENYTGQINISPTYISLVNLIQTQSYLFTGPFYSI